MPSLQQQKLATWMTSLMNWMRLLKQQQVLPALPATQAPQQLQQVQEVADM
jgi:hypothetical protein